MDKKYGDLLFQIYTWIIRIGCEIWGRVNRYFITWLKKYSHIRSTRWHRLKKCRTPQFWQKLCGITPLKPYVYHAFIKASVSVLNSKYKCPSKILLSVTLYGLNREWIYLSKTFSLWRRHLTEKSFHKDKKIVRHHTHTNFRNHSCHFVAICA